MNILWLEVVEEEEEEEEAEVQNREQISTQRAMQIEKVIHRHHQNHHHNKNKKANPSIQTVIQSKGSWGKATKRQDSHTGYMQVYIQEDRK